MTSLRVESLDIDAAPFGPASSLPPLEIRPGVRAELDAAAAGGVLGDDVGYGTVPSILPYTRQRGYGRDRARRQVPVAVLENDILRAVFLLEAGGRLWSLTHRPSGRELLYTNRVLQPANLALRGAWFAGGVEWNIGTIGHSPFTASPLHAVAVQAPDGSPVLRLYEWERIRSVAFQIDVLLPDGSPVLYVVPRIRNHHPHPVPMYWWSNMAVPEMPGSRVVVPADSAYSFQDHELGVVDVPLPSPTERDITYPSGAPHSADWFFRLPAGQPPWIAALDAAGEGLAQASTARLPGRKLFVWGNRPGGRHWQEWLSGGEGRYFEIQAGLAPTQLQHVRMPAETTWAWAEAYGRIDVDPDAVHGPDWDVAVRETGTAIDKLVSAATLETVLADADRLADTPPRETLHTGSGWGALERLRRHASAPAADHDEGTGPETAGGTGIPFPLSTLGPDQRPWVALLAGGPLGDVPPGSFVTDAHWLPLLADAEPAWPTQLHLGVARWAAGDRAGAVDAWQASVAAQPNPAAARNLGMAARLDDRPGDAVRHLEQAWSLAAPDPTTPDPEVVEILTELLDALVAVDPAAAVALIDELPLAVTVAGRTRLIEARAAVAAGELARARRVLDAAVVLPDVREGEVTFEQVWTDLVAADPSAATGDLPAIYDFRA